MINFLYMLFLAVRLPRAARERHTRFGRVLKMLHRLRLAFFMVMFSLLTGTLGYVIIEGYPWFDAYYMAVITLASVGFSEVHPLGQAGRLFTTFLILFNVGLFAYAISTITSIFAEGGFNKLLHDLRMIRQIEAMQGHTIICGYGRHATVVTEALAKQGHPFVVIDNKSESIEILRRDTPYLFIEGDATHDEVLEEAGLRRAATLVVTLPNDADNLFIVLSARQINPGLRIISRASNYADEVKIRRAGADHTVVPEQIGGFFMATLVNKPDLVEFFTTLSNMGPSNVVFEELMVSRLAPKYQGKSLAECKFLANNRVALVALRRPDGQYEFNPAQDEILRPDDHIVVLGNADQISQFLNEVA